MAETKRKTKPGGKRGGENSKKFSRRKQLNSKTRKNDAVGVRKRGPRLPMSLTKEVENFNPGSPSNSDEDIASDVDSVEEEILGKDVYEYEEEQAEEEFLKNRRFDSVLVDKSEYDLPGQISDDFQDENVPSDDELEGGSGSDNAMNKNEEDSGNEAEEEDDGRHARMLQSITGMPSHVFEGKKKKKKNDVIYEPYPESEFNPTHDILDGSGRISIQDLLEPLKNTSGYLKLQRRLGEIEKKSKIIHAPLPKADQEKIERKVAYDLSKKEITKWEPIVKRNREAPTIVLGKDIDLGFSTVGAIASKFEPRTELEKKLASLFHDDELTEAHKKDGSRLLEMNMVSVEDEKERQNRIAKMRSLLFHHELKAKKIKKIKSKTYHRIQKKDRLKSLASQIEMDPEAAKEYAMKCERERAEERMTLRHKNSSKWAKRMLSRGLHHKDEGTRAAIGEQLQQHAALTRKMNSMWDNSSNSEDSSDEDDFDDSLVNSDQGQASRLLEKAKDKTAKLLEDDRVPESGVLSLPFMRRALERQKEAASEEAKLALQEYESSQKKLKDPSEAENHNAATTSGRMLFGAPKTQAPEASKKTELDNFYGSSDGEDDLQTVKNVEFVNDKSDDLQKGFKSDSVTIHEDSVFKNIRDIIKDPGSNTTFEVSIFASDKWNKVKTRKEEISCITKSQQHMEAVDKEIKETEEDMGEDSDADCEGQMVDGILSSEPKHSYKLPSQEELICEAFATDDVEGDFEKDKEEILNEENPEPEKTVSLPGWGQWTDIQKKKGLPFWMVKEHDIARKKREEALKRRKDANLKHVIISEKIDKKAEKLHTKQVPYPFTSKEVFEQSIRMPIGPEFNPVTTLGALNRPEVVKRPGVIINPIEFEEVNPHDKREEKNGQKDKRKRIKNSTGKTEKKAKTQ